MFFYWAASLSNTNANLYQTSRSTVLDILAINIALGISNSTLSTVVLNPGAVHSQSNNIELFARRLIGTVDSTALSLMSDLDAAPVSFLAHRLFITYSLVEFSKNNSRPSLFLRLSQGSTWVQTP